MLLAMHVCVSFLALPHADLDLVAAKLAASIESADLSAVSPRVCRKADRDWALVSVWPHKIFRTALLDTTRSSDAQVVAAAFVGLRIHGEKDIEAIAAPHLNDERRVHRADVDAGSLGDVIATIVSSPRRSDPLEDLPDLLPNDEEGLCDVIAVSVKTVTLPEAVELLESRSVSIRLQSFVWLMNHGIVISAQPLIDAWDRLSNDCRLVLLDEMRELPQWRYGSNALKEALTVLLARATEDSCRAGLLATLCALGAREAAKDAKAFLEAPGIGQDDLDRLYRGLAIAEADASVTPWLQRVGSPRIDVRIGSLQVLARSNSVIAMRAVTGWLVSANDNHEIGRVLAQLRWRSWESPAARRACLRGLADVLEYVRASRADDPQRLTQLQRDVVQTLEAITNVFCGIETKEDTIDKWLLWLRVNEGV